MAKESDFVKVIHGGWYQRTTLHLSEVHGFLSNAETKLDLNKNKLKELHKNLNLKKVERITEDLEFIKATTKDGIEIRYYEDGLHLLEKDTKTPRQTSKILKEYLDKKLSPALSYIFSLGAPTPKILANIKKSRPMVLGLIDRNHRNLKIPKKYGEVYSKITSKNITLYKTKEFIFVATTSAYKKTLSDLIETQIFFREFKDQLERYLDIHRKVWEEIAQIKEKEEIKAKDLGKYKSQLESYEKSISLIRSRINQMTTYAKTRASTAKKLKIDSTLTNLFQYKFETLFDTLAYIKETWNVTQNYVSSAIKVISNLQSQSSSSTLKSIRTITSVGFIAGIIGYLSRDSIPQLNPVGTSYFIGLIILGILINYITKRFDKNKKYKVKFTERSKEI